MPEKRARRVVARGRVEIGQALVRLAARARILGALGLREELVGQARDAPRPELGALARDAAERRVRVVAAASAQRSAPSSSPARS